uniref:Uncharacterized protein n=1 Tax=Myotis myotis TaxID=51298 RepID=A0A7J7TTQ1_MYOMY|nr:hypothetical protein mMyoMyo1_008972 [Myotis myotis]
MTLKKLIYYFSGFAYDEELAKINKAMVEMENNLDEKDIEVVPEQLTEELLDLEEEHRAEEEAGVKETAGEEKKNRPATPRKFTMEGRAEAFGNFNKFLKEFDPQTKRFLLLQRNVHGALSAYKQI